MAPVSSWADGNQAVTNAHVLPEATEDMAGMSIVVQVRRPGGGELSMRQATVLQVDRVHDLALLRFEGAGGAGAACRRLERGARRPGGGLHRFSDRRRAGLFAGHAPRLIASITPAAMPTPSARVLNEATIRSVRAGAFDIFQLDGTAYPGNSGGPLFDPETGDVLGVVNMVFIKGSRESALSQPSGISYAIPSRFVAALIEDGLRK